jgi:hypothetical protein
VLVVLVTLETFANLLVREGEEVFLCPEAV